jgi:LPXTG-motif cell wall-anchored protein
VAALGPTGVPTTSIAPADGAPPISAGATAAAGPTAGGQLPATGSSSTPVLVMAMLLTVLGGSLTTVGRRRRGLAGDAGPDHGGPDGGLLTRVGRWASWVVSIAAAGFSATATVGDRHGTRHHADSPNGRSLPYDEP